MPSDRPLALSILSTLERAGFIALLAGGCVRDEVLGKEPSDYDIATNATPDHIAKLFARTAHVGAHFGVVLVRDGPRTVEVATFRSDGVYEDARRPKSVRFSSPLEDAQRRDFTVNALFWKPTSEPSQQAGIATVPTWMAGAEVIQLRHGTVIDFVGGMRDMQAKVLRAVGDPHARLAEDHLRALRAVRLAAKLDFAIEENTKAAIVRHAMELRGVSPERIGDECRQMFEHPSRARAAELLAELGLVAAMLGTPDRALAQRSSDLLARATPPGERASVGYAMLAWAHGLGVQLVASEGGASVKTFVNAARDGLCLSNDETTQMLQLAARLQELDEVWQHATIAKRKRILQSKEVENARKLFALLKPEEAQTIDKHSQALQATPSGIRPHPLLTGDHLLAAGAKAGPAFKTVLDAVYDAQLEERVANAEEALAMGLMMLKK